MLTERLEGHHAVLRTVYPKDIPPMFLEIARGNQKTPRFYQLDDKTLIDTTLNLLKDPIERTNLQYPVEISDTALNWEITYASGANQAAWSRRGAKINRTGDWRLASDHLRWERKSTAEIYDSLDKKPRKLTEVQKEFETICQANYDTLREISHTLTRDKFYTYLYAAVEARQRSRIGLLGRMARTDQRPPGNGQTTAEHTSVLPTNGSVQVTGELGQVYVAAGNGQSHQTAEEFFRSVVDQTPRTQVRHVPFEARYPEDWFHAPIAPAREPGEATLVRATVRAQRRQSL